ncbi:hypothetical protein MTO96_007364 [Rhipicephalus appendiculatus]
MYESSAQRVVGSRPKVRRAGGPATSALQNIRNAVGQRKWKYVIGACFLLSVVAVVLPASAARSAKRTSPHRHAAAPAHNTAAQNGAADEQRAVYHAPAANKKSPARSPTDHHVAKARKAAPAASAARKRRRTTSPTRKPPNIAEEKEHEDEPEKNSAADEPEPAAVQNAPEVLAPAAADKDDTQASKGRTTKAGNAEAIAKKVAAHRQSEAPSNESIFRFATPTLPSDPGDHNDENIRLPKNVRPVGYKLVLVPEYQDQSMSFKGSVRIMLEALEPTKLIQLHAANLVINRGNLTLRFASGAPGPDILSIRTNDFSQFLYINLAEDLLAGGQRDEGPPVWVYGANFLPTEARRTFPCFDEPGIKAPFIIEVIRPNNLHTVSNMPLSATYKKRNDTKADVFITSFPMSTFATGFFISDFVSYGNSTMKLWARPGAAKDVDFLLTMGPQILKFYEEYFASAYQLPKTDVIAMEHYISDIQNMGLLYLPESIAFYDAEDSSISKRQTVMLSLCHAFSHEWFGNLVSPEWWDDVWLMDGFATYFQYRCLEYFDQTAEIGNGPTTVFLYDLMLVNEIVPVMKHDIMKFAPAVVTSVDTQYRIYQSFNVFSTQKAVALLRMLDMAVGEEHFKMGVYKVLDKRMFGNVTSAFVWEAFTEAMPKKRPLKVANVMEPWVTQPGFPMLMVNRVYDENAATLVQSKFALEPEERESRFTWPIPITFVSSEQRLFDNTMPTIWLYDKEGGYNTQPCDSLGRCKNLGILVCKFAGYYKVNYDVHNWDLIIRQLLWNHTYIHPLNRAQIQNDLFDLAKAGLVNYTVALEATKYLLKEQDYIPWKAAFEKMKDVGVRLQTTESYSKWKGYMSSLLSANFANISWDGNETSLLSTELESELAFLTCYYGYQPCIDKALKMFREVKESTTAGDDLPTHLRYTVFCEAVKTGGEKNWKFLWDRLQESDDPSERSDIIKALSCSRSAQLLGNYLKSVVAPDDVIRHEDIPGLFTSFSDNHEGKPVAFKFINDEWGSIHKRFRDVPEVLFQIEESLLETASESADAKTLSSFYKHNKQSTKIPEWRYKQVQEERRLDDAWKAKFYPVVKHWLDEIELAV